MARISGLVGGSAILGLGVVLTVQAGLGPAPWDVLHLAFAGRTSWTLGQASIGTSMAIFLVTLLLRGGWSIRWGTLVNTLVVGSSIDLYLWLGVPAVTAFPARLFFLGAGMFCIALGSVVYTRAGLGAGARDGLTLTLSQRLPLTVGRVRLALELLVTLTGWLLGGPVGIGTALIALGTGPIADQLFRLLGRGQLPSSVRIPGSHSTRGPTGDKSGEKSGKGHFGSHAGDKAGNGE